jgi:hypothetical protein
MHPSAALFVLTLVGEIPLPDATLYGTLATEGGVPVTTGAIVAQVRRGGNLVLQVSGSLRQDAGKSYYVVNVPLETNIGAPGPSGVGAREGDGIGAVLLNGTPITLIGPAPPPLAAGAVTRIDATAPPGAGGLTYARGDCSPDRKVDISDALRVLGYLFLGSGVPPCLEACDGDGSGVLNISDAVWILGYLFLGTSPPPAPGPTCGVDPSPSALGCQQSPCAS